MTKPLIFQQNHISVLTPYLREKTKMMKIVSAFGSSGTTSEGGSGDTALLPRAPMERHCVFKSDPETGTYSHHAAICKWKERYYYVFSNGDADECAPGQSTFICNSDNGISWTKPQCLIAGDRKEGIFLRTLGIFVWQGKMIVFAQKNQRGSRQRRPGMSVNDGAKNISRKIDAYVTDDAENWQVHENIVGGDHMIFEEPRLTSRGRLLVPGTDPETFRPTALLWPGDNPLEKPEIIYLPFHTEDMGDGKEFANPQGGHFPYGEASLYEDDDGRIWMYMRDEGASERLFISISEDGGENWTEPMISDMPDSMSRIYVGKLNDGRYFLVGNTASNLMDRSKLILSLSDDGATFDKMYILVDDETGQTHEGHLKANGYQYPNCLVDGDKLMIAYSVNKEDMECGILDVTKI